MIPSFFIQMNYISTDGSFYARELDPLVLPSETSQGVKQRVLNFVRSLSTVLAFAYCSSR